MLLIEISAITDPFTNKAQVHLVLLFYALKDGAGESLPQDSHNLLVSRGRELVLGNPLKLAIDAISEAVVGLRVKVCGVLLGAPIQQFSQGSGYSDSFHKSVLV